MANIVCAIIQYQQAETAHGTAQEAASFAASPSLFSNSCASQRDNFDSREISFVRLCTFNKRSDGEYQFSGGNGQALSFFLLPLALSAPAREIFLIFSQLSEDRTEEKIVEMQHEQNKQTPSSFYSWSFLGILTF